MGNVGFAAEGGAKKVKLAITGRRKTSRMIRVVGHTWRTCCDLDAADAGEEPQYECWQIWVETERSHTLGWVLSRVIEESLERGDLPNIVGLRVTRKSQRGMSDVDLDASFLHSVEDDLVLDYGEAVDSVLGRGDSLEVLFEVPSTPRYTEPAPTPEEGSDRVERIGLGHFAICRPLGVGATSKVYQVRHKGNHENYAMKIMSKRRGMKDEKSVERVVTEKRILAKLSHPFLVSLHWAFQTSGHLFLVLEYCSGGELFTYFQNDGKFSEEDTRFYGAEILLGLEYLHKEGILYRDLKLENCLLDVEGHICLTDFGLSRDSVTETDLCQSFCGTATYISPEMLLHEGHGLPLDFYCLGCLLHLLLTERVPHESSQGLQVMYNRRISGGKCKLPRSLSREVSDLINGLVQTLPSKRLCRADDVKNHAWFREVDWVKVLNKEPQVVFPNFPPIDPQMFPGENFDNALDASLEMSAIVDSGTIAGFYQGLGGA